MNVDQQDKERKAIEPRTEREQEKVINRLNRIECQVRGLQNMVEEDRYCMDILIQVSAVQSALKKVGYTLMERHVKTCMVHSIRNGQDEEVLKELMEIVNQYSK